MNMKKPEVPPALRAYVMTCAQRHAFNLKVEHYQVSITYIEEPKRGNEEENTAGEMDVQRRYMAANLRLYPCVLQYWKDGKKKLIEEIVAHEYAHLVTQHFIEVATATYRDEGEMKDAWEGVTEVIARLSCTVAKLKMKKQ